MNSIKLRGVFAAVSGALMFGATGVAMADTTDDLLKALRDKGVLTQNEFDDFNTSRDMEKVKKSTELRGKINIGNFIHDATIYGDVRVRYEHRDGEDTAVIPISEDRNRGRYKITLGVKTEANNFFYSDLALAMGSRGRSDNATFAGVSGSANNGANDKETLFVKRALIGWHGVDWLTVEAGRVANPLYTTEMVWDKDLTLEGLTEKLNYTVGNTEFFANLVQSYYLGDKKNYSNGTVANGTDKNNNFLLAFQGGANFKLADQLTGKAALTYTTYTHDRAAAAAGQIFQPGRGATTGNAYAGGTNPLAVNDVRPIEIPFELSYKANDKYTITAFGDYVHNLDGSDRQAAACAALAAGADKTAVCNAGTDSNAWLLGAGIKSGTKAGDWEAKVWWQEVGMYAVDPNTVDSDIFDSRVNMKGVVFKGVYNIEDNVFLNFTGAHANRKDKSLAAVGGAGTDLSVNIDDYNLYQVDLTYRF